MGNGWRTRRHVIAGLSAAGAASASGLFSQAQQASAQPGSDVASVTNNILVIGYNYVGLPGLDTVVLADAALSIARKFYGLKKVRREINGRAMNINVSVLHNSKTALLDPNGAPTSETFEKFLERPLKGSNVILYFVGHGILNRGIELVDDTGKATPAWDYLGRIGEKEPATRVAIVDCCRRSDDFLAEKIGADVVSKAGEEVAFIFSTPPNEVAKGNVEASFEGTAFSRTFEQRLSMQVELSSLFQRVRQDLRATGKEASKDPSKDKANLKADPIMHTSLSRPVWLAGAPEAYGHGSAVKLFFPG